MTSNLPKQILQQQFDQLIAAQSHIEFVLAVTADGHLVASASRSEHNFKRLAAMGSTLVSLGDTVSSELNMGNCRNLIAENDGGIVVFMHITKSLMLVAQTSNRNGLGMLLSAARSCVEKIVAELKAAITPQ